MHRLVLPAFCGGICGSGPGAQKEGFLYLT